MMVNHLSGDDELPYLPLQLWATTHISTREEMLMGIPQEMTERWRADNQVLDSDDIQIIRDEEIDADEESVEEEPDFIYEEEEEARLSISRKRGISAASTTSRQGSPTKRHQGSQ